MISILEEKVGVCGSLERVGRHAYKGVENISEEKVEWYCMIITGRSRFFSIAVNTVEI